MAIKKKRSKTKSKKRPIKRSSKKKAVRSSKRTVKRTASRTASRTVSRTAPKQTHIESIILHATKINPVYYGISKGVAVGIAFFVVGLLSAAGNFARPFVQLMSTVLIGYSPSFIGAIVGGVWAFVYFTVIGMISACFYNMLHH